MVVVLDTLLLHLLGVALTHLANRNEFVYFREDYCGNESLILVPSQQGCSGIDSVLA